MEKFIREITDETPYIQFDNLTGTFEISGRSFPERAFEFYRPLFEWIDDYKKVPPVNTALRIQLDYINSGSIKCLLELIIRLSSIADNTHRLVVYWLYEKGDEEIKEIGEDLEAVSGLKFNIGEGPVSAQVDS